MAQPPLDHQIKHAGRILVCTTAIDEGGLSYAVEEALKGVTPHGPLHPDAKIFKLLGYEPVEGETVVLFFSRKNELIELLPVRDGRLVYAPNDSSVLKELSLDAFRGHVHAPV